MTIFRFDIAKLMLLDVFETWDDWHDELGIITGFYWDEYQALYQRISIESEVVLSSADKDMLYHAANQFLGYPAIRTSNLESAFGKDWEQILDNAFGKRWNF